MTVLRIQHKEGDTFEHNGEAIKAVKVTRCKDCVFDGPSADITPECQQHDCTGLVFMRVTDIVARKLTGA